MLRIRFLLLPLVLFAATFAHAQSSGRIAGDAADPHIVVNTEKNVDAVVNARAHGVGDNTQAYALPDRAVSAIRLRTFRVSYRDDGAERQLIGEVDGACSDHGRVGIRAACGRIGISVGLGGNGVVAGQTDFIARWRRRRRSTSMAVTSAPSPAAILAALVPTIPAPLPAAGASSPAVASISVYRLTSAANSSRLAGVREKTRKAVTGTAVASASGFRTKPLRRARPLPERMRRRAPRASSACRTRDPRRSRRPRGEHR